MDRHHPERADVDRQTLQDLWARYKLRLKRRRLLFRAVRKKRQLRSISDKTRNICPTDILAFATVRNEALRLPFFLEHYRRLGVAQFLIVDNDSTDDTQDFLAAQPDVSVWHTTDSYRLSRFGLDWLTWLMIRHGHGHWCLTVDADEILIYPHWETRPLAALTEWLDECQTPSFAAMMLDMYPKGPVNEQRYVAGQNPLELLKWFDHGNYRIQLQAHLDNLWIQGGVRARMFFNNTPQRAPTMNKTPLVRWHRRYAYLNSTHAVLPPRLNKVYGDEEQLCGLLLHTKFLDTIVDKSAEEKNRKEHFNNSAIYDDYYTTLMQGPDLWCDRSTRYIGWKQMEKLGLMSRGTWL
jgi:glycosyltransferase involved in cell wall biosynthesis